MGSNLGLGDSKLEFWGENGAYKRYDGSLFVSVRSMVGLG